MLLTELATNNLTESSPDNLAVLALIISGIAAFITLAIAWLNRRAVCEMKRQGGTLLKQTKASILQKCTESYSDEWLVVCFIVKRYKPYNS